MATIRAFFPKLGHFFLVFEKRQGNLPPPTAPSSYAPEHATRKHGHESTENADENFCIFTGFLLYLLLRMLGVYSRKMEHRINIIHKRAC